ncbi:hypothetical protein CSB69_2750 [Morganella morganii]|nr:hypothetical protein CSB69_2750 [Morganella morganii]EMP53198.1 hypothetical protein C790_03174 [Morganella morganii SC01]
MPAPGTSLDEYTVFLRMTLIRSGNNRKINLMNIRSNYQ